MASSLSTLLRSAVRRQSCSALLSRASYSSSSRSSVQNLFNVSIPQTSSSSSSAPFQAGAFLTHQRTGLLQRQHQFQHQFQHQHQHQHQQTRGFAKMKSKKVATGGVDVQTALAELRAHAEETKKRKFVESVDVAVHLNIDVRKSDQNVRGAVELPHGTGKSVSVAVFARGAKADEAKEAGADVVGAEELVEKVKGGWLDFERCIATPDMMGQVSQIARILGPKGLMPNPKLGTITMDVATAVASVKKGQASYRAEKNGIIHACIGKLSMSDKQLLDNLKALQQALLDARPKSAPKGVYFTKFTMSTTMGPGVVVDRNRINPATRYFLLKHD